jgi:BlaI family penicillinase repressor
MNKLEEKKYLQKEKIGLVNFYLPTISKLNVLKKETRGFIDRLYDGSARALINQLVDSDSLTREEIAELRALIDKKQREQK